MLIVPVPKDEDAAVERVVRMFRHIGSRGFPFDEAATRDPARRAYRRGFYPAGTARQMAAIVKSGDRTAELARITAPTLVLHGDHDPMVNPSGGRATAKAIPGARLQTITGIGTRPARPGRSSSSPRCILAHAERADAAAVAAAG